MQYGIDILTWLSGRSSLVSTSRNVLADLGTSRLLGVWCDLLGDLLTNTFAEIVRHFEGCV